MLGSMQNGGQKITVPHTCGFILFWIQKGMLLEAEQESVILPLVLILSGLNVKTPPTRKHGENNQRGECPLAMCANCTAKKHFRTHNLACQSQDYNGSSQIISMAAQKQLAHLGISFGEATGANHLQKESSSSEARESVQQHGTACEKFNWKLLCLGVANMPVPNSSTCLFNIQLHAQQYIKDSNVIETILMSTVCGHWPGEALQHAPLLAWTKTSCHWPHGWLEDWGGLEFMYTLCFVPCDHWLMSSALAHPEHHTDYSCLGKNGMMPCSEAPWHDVKPKAFPIAWGKTEAGQQLAKMRMWLMKSSSLLDYVDNSIDNRAANAMEAMLCEPVEHLGEATQIPGFFLGSQHCMLHAWLPLWFNWNRNGHPPCN